MKELLLVLVLISILGCSGSNDANSFSETEDGLYPDSIFELNTSSIGSLEELNSDILDLPPKLNSYLITTIGSSRTEISLKLHSRNPRVMFDDPSIWALFIRTAPNPVGVKNYDELQINLFYDYSVKDQICCVNTLPFEDFDMAEESYIATGGFIDFVSEKEGMFVLTFQREVAVHGGVTIEPNIEISGCWFIAEEQGVSGCAI